MVFVISDLLENDENLFQRFISLLDEIMKRMETRGKHGMAAPLKKNPNLQGINNEVTAAILPEICYSFPSKQSMTECDVQLQKMDWDDLHVQVYITRLVEHHFDGVSPKSRLLMDKLLLMADALGFDDVCDFFWNKKHALEGTQDLLEGYRDDDSDYVTGNKSEDDDDSDKDTDDDSEYVTGESDEDDDDDDSDDDDSDDDSSDEETD